MKYILPCILLIVITSFTVLSSITVETASFSEFMYGSTDNTAYDDFYSRVVEGLASPGYNQYAPWDRQTNGFGNFVNANSNQRANWGQVVDLFLAGLYTEAQTAIDLFGFPYEVVEFHDTDTGRTYYMLRELLNMAYFDDNNAPEQPEIHQHGSFDYGWGLYVFNPSSDVPLIVNVVHPKDDFISIPVATKAFQLWDARYYMVAGAGREALWTNESPYWNSKSLSDPSRNASHVFNVTYQRMCDEIRDSFARRELSVQVHSYDYTHEGYKPLQFSSGGWAFNYPGLPVRDISGNNLDLINASPYVVIPANTVGVHDDVLVTDYYSVLYDQHGLYYSYGDQLLPISNHINLPGANTNRQVLYTRSNWNQYNVYDCFIHLEMEELPSVYPQTMNYYRWLYGFDAVTQTWDADNLWTRALEFYTPWLEHFAQILPEFIEMDDGLPPTNPENLSMVSTSYNNIVLEWERSYSYDFLTYEILYATEPVDPDNPNYTIINRSNINTLAGQAFTRATITNLDPGTQYYFRIRARDYNNNFSELSNEIARFTGSATIANLRAYGRDSYVEISWLAQYQANNQGFNIYRAVSGSENYEMIATWETDSLLAGTTEDNTEYSYVDTQAVNGFIYDYKVASVDVNNTEYLHVFVTSASPQPLYILTVQNNTGIIYDTVEFGSNPFATDGYDSNFDILKGSPPGGDYIYSMSYKSNWNVALRNLQRDIYRYYDPELEVKTRIIRVSTDQTYQPISISVDDAFLRNSEKLYLRDNSTGNMVDLTQGNLIYEAGSTAYRNFTLYRGNLLPIVSFPNLSNRFVQSGDEIDLTWSTTFSLLIDSIDLYLANETDSLLIASNLPSDATSYFWVVPDNVSLLDAELVIRTNVIDGYPLTHHSSFRFGVIPATIVFDNPSGWHLQSNPIVSPNLPGAVLFGQDAQLYVYDYDYQEYQGVTTFHFGQGHWVFIPQSYEVGTSGRIQKLQFDIPLQEGWNLIPNVHMSDVDSRDFLFILNNNEYSFIEALQYGLIERSLYNVVENRYFLNDYLPRQEALWLHVNEPGLILRLKPFHKNPDHSQFPYLWQTKIIARQGDYLGDEIIIGSALSTNDDYNRLFDLPKPPARPETDFYLYLTANGTSHPFTELHSYFKSDLDNEQSDTRLWDFTLMLDPDLQPVYFRKQDFELPDDYIVVLVIGNSMFELSEDQDFVYNPTTEIIIGQVLVTNDEDSSVEELPITPFLFHNYPNPFFVGSSSRSSPGTNIAFYLEKRDDVKLEIFNIKGQRVITLLDERREPGRHAVFWNGKDSGNKTVSAGIYLYRLATGEGTEYVNKMLLLK